MLDIFFFRWGKRGELNRNFINFRKVLERNRRSFLILRGLFLGGPFSELRRSTP